MGFLRVCLAVTTSLWRSRRSAGSWAGAADAPMEVYAAVVPAADVSRSIDDSELVLERLATPSAMNSNPVSVGASDGFSRHNEAPVRAPLFVVDPDPWGASRRDLH
jgi:hypothetical protein